MYSEWLNEFRPRAGEAEDRLSRIAHGENPRPSLSVNQLQDFDLKFGRVLEFVDKETRKTTRKRMTDQAMIAQKAIGLINDVGEVNEAHLSAFFPEVRAPTPNAFFAN